MTVTISLDTREFIDLMNPPRLDNASDIILSQDREREEFKRTVEDVKLRTSDQQNELTKKFRAYPITSNWEVNVIDDGRQLFRGRIQRPITSDVKEDWLEIQAFSKNKDFWEKAKVTLIPRTHPGLYKSYYPFDPVQDTLSKVLPYIVGPLSNDDLFSGIYIDTLYTSRLLRTYGSADPTTIGNEGQYVNLDPATTIFELLTATAIYYNAEFFIDPETDLLTMLKRNTVQNDLEHNLDELILNDEEIRYDDSDEKKYDYVEMIAKIPKAGQLSNIIQRRRVNLIGTPSYQMTYTLSSGSSFIESEPSDPAYTDQDIDLNNSPSDPYYSDTSFPLRRWFTLPLGPTGTIKRNVYALVWGVPGSHPKPMLLFSIDDNTTTEYVYDGYNPISEITLDVAILAPLIFYYRYDETTGAWVTPVVKKLEDDPPPGKIFKIFPDLKFVDETGSVKDDNALDIFSFFGRELNFDTFAEQWLDVFITKGRAYCAVKDLAYRLGDSFITSRHPKIPAGKYVVKKAMGRLMKERTQVELIKV